ncbi:MAG: Gfo/Idh/MocA family oxidoreductase, partial [Candidatus Pacebacteria bacterium]|nr:Gfo/Idh/MocA family oxidoreductase [Candidatus Paceibacterota bacterium]
MKTVKVGVVGVGALGQHHARIYNEIEGAELVGVYDANPRQGKKIAKSNNTVYYTSMDALAEAVDAISVAVPTDRHREIGGALLEKGVHLLMEKPISVTTQEAEELVALAEKHN